MFTQKFKELALSNIENAYIRLFDGDPNNGGTEVTNDITGSGAVQITPEQLSQAQVEETNARMLFNSDPFTVTTSANNTSDLNVSHIAVSLSPTSTDFENNFLLVGELVDEEGNPQPKTIKNNDLFRFRTNEFKLTL